MPTAAQTKKIWASAREVGLEESELRDLVFTLSGARSISKLSDFHARELIDLLVRGGARKGTPKPKPSGRRKAPNEVQMITPGQRTEIERRRTALGGDWLRDEYFAGACRKRIKLDAPRTAAQAAQVIEMLKERAAYNAGKEREGR
jgi:hypothetical protein